MQNELVCVSANHVAIFRDVKYKGQVHELCILRPWR